MLMFGCPGKPDGEEIPSMAKDERRWWDFGIFAEVSGIAVYVSNDIVVSLAYFGW